MNVSDVTRAEELVVRDRRRDRPSLRYEEALVEVVDAVDLEDVVGDDEVAEAYRLVIADRVPPTRSQLLDLVGLLAREGVPQLTVAQRVWAWRAERGTLR